MLTWSVLDCGFKSRSGQSNAHLECAKIVGSSHGLVKAMLTWSVLDCGFKSRSGQSNAHLECARLWVQVTVWSKQCSPGVCSIVGSSHGLVKAMLTWSVLDCGFNSRSGQSNAHLECARLWVQVTVWSKQCSPGVC